MSGYPITIIITTDEANTDEAYTISVPSNIFSLIKDINNVKLKLGAAIIDVQCGSNDTDDSIIMTRITADKMSLYPGLKTNLLVKENTLCLGPLIGSFTDTTSVRIASKQRPGIKIGNLSKSNRDSATVLYFFSVDDYLSEEEKVNGTYYNYVTEQWEKNCFLFPMFYMIEEEVV